MIVLTCRRLPAMRGVMLPPATVAMPPTAWTMAITTALFSAGARMEVAAYVRAWAIVDQIPVAKSIANVILAPSLMFDLDTKAPAMARVTVIAMCQRRSGMLSEDQ